MFHRLEKRMFDFIVGVVDTGGQTKMLKIDTPTAFECEVSRRLFEQTHWVGKTTDKDGMLKLANTDEGEKLHHEEFIGYWTCTSAAKVAKRVKGLLSKIAST